LDVLLAIVVNDYPNSHQKFSRQRNGEQDYSQTVPPPFAQSEFTVFGAEQKKNYG
jgi:hypothetical protein